MKNHRPPKNHYDGNPFAAEDPNEKVERRLIPIIAIVCGVFAGVGAAYLAKRYIFGGPKKRGEITIVEGSDRSRRPRMKMEARVYTVETAEYADEVSDQGDMPLPAEEPETMARAVEPQPASVQKRPTVAPAPAPVSRKLSPKKAATPRIAMAVEPPPPRMQDVLADEPKLPPRVLTLRNLTYNRQAFQQCPIDCTLVFVSSDGKAVKVKLRKTSFEAVLSRDLATVDLDVFESSTEGEPAVVKSLRGTPAPAPQVAAIPREASKPANEDKAPEPKADKSKKDKVRDDPNWQPIEMVKPVMPKEAAAKGITGWIKFRVDINEDGRPENIVVVDAQNRSVFEDEARKAVRKWKYAPRMVNGQPVKVSGHMIMIAFKVGE